MIILETRTCIECGEDKPLDDVHWVFTQPRKIRYPRSRCKACWIPYQRRLRDVRFEAHPEKLEARKANRRNRKMKGYGLTQEDFLRQSEAQDHCCAICGKERKLHVDHNHESGKVRGLLCSPCNTSLGLLCESPKILESMIEYLKEHHDNS